MIPTNKATLACAIAGAALLAGAVPASAHHTASMFDRSKPVMVTGVVKELAWVNPHASLQVVANPGQPEAGKTWVLEMTSPGVLSRKGWTKRSLKPGDKVEVEIGPLRTGGPAGILMQVKNLTTGEIVGSPGAN